MLAFPTSCALLPQSISPKEAWQITCALPGSFALLVHVQQQPNAGLWIVLPTRVFGATTSERICFALVLCMSR